MCYAVTAATATSKVVPPWHRDVPQEQQLAIAYLKQHRHIAVTTTNPRGHGGDDSGASATIPPSTARVARLESQPGTIPRTRLRRRLAAGHYASGGTRGSDSRGSTTQGPIRGVRKRGGDVGRLATMASGVSTRAKQAVDLSVPREAGAATHTDARRPRRGGRPINNRASLGWIRARGCQHRHVHA